MTPNLTFRLSERSTEPPKTPKLPNSPKAVDEIAQIAPTAQTNVSTRRFHFAPIALLTKIFKRPTSETIFPAATSASAKRAT